MPCTKGLRGFTTYTRLKSFEEPLNDCFLVGVSVGAENLERQQVCLGRNANESYTVSTKENEATVPGNSLITFAGNDTSHMGAVAKIVHRVVIRIGRRVRPVSISYEVIATEDLEAWADAATKLSRVESVNSHITLLDRSYCRMGVLDTAVDDRNSGSSPPNTILM